MSLTGEPTGVEPVTNPEEKKSGRNVTITLRLMRHGERDKDGNLTDLGRGITRQVAGEDAADSPAYDAVKAIGSPSGPRDETSQMPRSQETAHIYKETLGDTGHITRENDLLGLDFIKSKSPYNHKQVYNSALPPNFEELPDPEKIKVAKTAQTTAVNHLLSIHTPEAQAYKQEVAGAYAKTILHYERMARKLNSGSNVLHPAGTHGGTMELILEQALVRKGENGQADKMGFETLDEIGGDIDPSDYFDITIATDEEGNLKPLTVKFHQATRPQGEMYLDQAKVDELAQFFDEIHKKEKPNHE